MGGTVAWHALHLKGSANQLGGNPRARWNMQGTPEVDKHRPRCQPRIPAARAQLIVSGLPFSCPSTMLWAAATEPPSVVERKLKFPSMEKLSEGLGTDLRLAPTPHCLGLCLPCREPVRGGRNGPGCGCGAPQGRAAGRWVGTLWPPGRCVQGAAGALGQVPSRPSLGPQSVTSDLLKSETWPSANLLSPAS